MNDKKHVDVINILLPVMLMTLTSLLFTEYNQSHLRVARKKKHKIEFYSCPTARDRSLCMRMYIYVHIYMYIYIYVYNHDNRQMHRFFFFFSFSFLSLLVFFLVPIIRATASVYSHEADGGGTLHLQYIYICAYLSV